jgi:outer membrane lipoprotein LolB
MLKQLLCLSLFLSLLSGCASNTPSTHQQTMTAATIEQRAQQLAQLTHWAVKGKIAFIEQKKRQSASLFWQVNQQDKRHYQRIDLTTFLGINILHVKSINNEHIIEVDGNTYQSRNLTALIYRLTGITLPTDALTYWLKGLPYSDNDQLQYAKQSPLPTKLISHYYQQTWQIDYEKYQLFQGYQLPTKITIKQNKLTIKIRIDDWSI